LQIAKIASLNLSNELTNATIFKIHTYFIPLKIPSAFYKFDLRRATNASIAFFLC
jgi:hypothetical protein